MCERAGRLVWIAALGLLPIGASHLGVGAVVLAQGEESPGNAVAAGELFVEPPTLINLGFEWLIEGDDNRNAAVEVSYRRQGETAWSPALPLLRLQRERISVGSQFDVVVPNMFAGSILDLEPDTAYEARFVMTDPDGVIGEADRTVAVRTRPEPVPHEGGRVFHVYPHGFEGAKIEPSFEGLICAYNSSCGGGDFATAGRPRVRAGDTLLVHAGLYRYNHLEYGGANRAFPFEGTYYLTADGTPERPIVIKAAGDGEVVFDGNGNFALFNVMAADYTYFEGITFRNTEFAIWAGQQSIAGAKGLTVKHSRFEDVGVGVFTNYSGSSNFYIADNRFHGRNDPERMIGWTDAPLWGRFDGVDGQVHPPVMASYVAVKLYGPGHVVAYNYIADFHDGINVETYGNPDGSVASGPGTPDGPDGPRYPPREYWDRRPVAIDFYNNHITNSHDNPIETDGSLHNVRVLRNLFINHPSHAFCSQPVLGGPVYWIRNIGYNLPGGSSRFFGARRRRVLQQHHPVRDHRDPVEHALAEQPDSRAERAVRLPGAASQPVRDHDVHQLHVVGLQRLRPRAGHRDAVSMGEPAVRRGRRLPGPGSHAGPRAARVRDARGVQRGDRAGPEQRSGGIRRVRERPSARRPGHRHAPGRVRRGRSRLSPEARLGRGRPGDGAADGDRRLHRDRARPRGAGGRGRNAALWAARPVGGADSWRVGGGDRRPWRDLANRVGSACAKFLRDWRAGRPPKRPAALRSTAGRRVVPATAPARIPTGPPTRRAA